MDHLFASPHRAFASRRDFLRRTGSGLGMLALAGMLEGQGPLGTPAAAAAAAVDPLAPKPPPTG